MSMGAPTHTHTIYNSWRNSCLLRTPEENLPTHTTAGETSASWGHQKRTKQSPCPKDPPHLGFQHQGSSPGSFMLLCPSQRHRIWEEKPRGSARGLCPRPDPRNNIILCSYDSPTNLLHCAGPYFGQLGTGQLQQGLQPRQTAVILYWYKVNTQCHHIKQILLSPFYRGEN